MKTTCKTILIAGLVIGGVLDTVSAQSRPAEIGSQNRSVNPYLFVGRVTTVHIGGGTYIGTGTAIRPNSVLTCGHNLYEIGRGWTQNVKFEWGRYDGAISKTSSASRRTVIGGYTTQTQNNSNYAFSRDFGIINFTTKPANGAYAGRWPNTSLLTTAGYTKMSVGYPAVTGFTGLRITQSRSTVAFGVVYGSYMQNAGYGIAGGMSGGPVMTWCNNAWWVTGVNVSGPIRNYSQYAGIRALDNEGETFVKNYAY